MKLGISEYWKFLLRKLANIRFRIEEIPFIFIYFKLFNNDADHLIAIKSQNSRFDHTISVY